MATTLERFMSKLRFSDEGCWVFSGAVQSNGYGRFWSDLKKVEYAHRFSFRYFRGEIPEGLDLDHLCRNRRCVNPFHLEPVTRSTNLQRGLAGENIAAPLRAKTHCPQGHPYEGSNLAVRNGRRHCKECARIRHQQTKARKKHGTTH